MLTIRQEFIVFQMGHQQLPDHSLKHFDKMTGKGHWSVIRWLTPGATFVDWTYQNQEKIWRNNSIKHFP